MQEKHFDGLVSPVEELESIKQIQKSLADKNVDKVEVSKVGSPAHRDAKRAWNDLSPNQKRSMRRRLKNRG